MTAGLSEKTESATYVKRRKVESSVRDSVRNVSSLSRTGDTETICRVLPDILFFSKKKKKKKKRKKETVRRREKEGRIKERGKRRRNQ